MSHNCHNKKNRCDNHKGQGATSPKRRGGSALNTGRLKIFPSHGGVPRSGGVVKCSAQDDTKYSTLEGNFTTFIIPVACKNGIIWKKYFLNHFVSSGHQQYQGEPDHPKQISPPKALAKIGKTSKVPKMRPLQRRHAPAICRGGFIHISTARPCDADPLHCSLRSIKRGFPGCLLCVAISTSCLREQANERV